MTTPDSGNRPSINPNSSVARPRSWSRRRFLLWGAGSAAGAALAACTPGSPEATSTIAPTAGATSTPGQTAEPLVVTPQVTEVFQPTDQVVATKPATPSAEPSTTPPPQEVTAGNVVFPDWHDVRDNRPTFAPADLTGFVDADGNPLFTDYEQGIKLLKEGIDLRKRALFERFIDANNVDIMTSVHRTDNPDDTRWVVYAETTSTRLGRRKGILWLRNPITGQFMNKPSSYPPEEQPENLDFVFLYPLHQDHRLVVGWYNREWPVVVELDKEGNFVRMFNQTTVDPTDVGRGIHQFDLSSPNWEPHYENETWSQMSPEDQQLVVDNWYKGVRIDDNELTKWGVLEELRPILERYLTDSDYSLDPAAGNLDDALHNIILAREAASGHAFDWAHNFETIGLERGLFTVTSIGLSGYALASPTPEGRIALTQEDTMYEAKDYFDNSLPESAKPTVRLLQVGANLIKEASFSALFMHIDDVLKLVTPQDLDLYFRSTPKVVGTGEALTMRQNVLWWSWVKRNVATLFPDNPELQAAVEGYASVAITNGASHIRNGNLDAINPSYP